MLTFHQHVSPEATWDASSQLPRWWWRHDSDEVAPGHGAGQTLASETAAFIWRTSATSACRAAWKLLCSLVQLPPWKIRAWSPARSCSNICAALSAFGVRSCCRDIPSGSTFNERCGRRSAFFLFLCKKNNSKAKDNVTPQQPGLHKSSGYLPKSDTVVLAQSYYPPATADDSACGNRKIHSQLQLLKIPIWYKSGWSLLFNFGWTFRLIFFAQNGHGGLISLISYNKITSGKDLFAASVGTIVTTNDAFSGPIFNLSAQVGHLITQCVVSATRGLPI